MLCPMVWLLILLLFLRFFFGVRCGSLVLIDTVSREHFQSIVIRMKHFQKFALQSLLMGEQKKIDVKKK